MLTHCWSRCFQFRFNTSRFGRFGRCLLRHWKRRFPSHRIQQIDFLNLILSSRHCWCILFFLSGLSLWQCWCIILFIFLFLLLVLPSWQWRWCLIISIIFSWSFRQRRAIFLSLSCSSCLGPSFSAILLLLNFKSGILYP